MKNGNQAVPEPANADEFMRAVVSATPAIMREVGGIVKVDVTISIDESGRIESFDLIRCRSITGRAMKPDEPEIVEAAKAAVSVLRFRPARHDGSAARHSSVQLSLGFTTAALDLKDEHMMSLGLLN
jgi:hypothetical protein